MACGLCRGNLKFSQLNTDFSIQSYSSYNSIIFRVLIKMTLPPLS
ncbi:hypothetical protein BVRB_3g065910 [Beta vulgaris subsp. vulgaris]|uniref:Uncharacterized protein n=1 Tax=Beta vulgaris subsp. vulgaris TaxID=3555 RepID=A0A0J8CMV6_BETVV|nr:hypothetical protein BVRB_3g065910 [Beta vulgaris subsp. vulgaris]